MAQGYTSTKQQNWEAKTYFWRQSPCTFHSAIASLYKYFQYCVLSFNQQLFSSMAMGGGGAKIKILPLQELTVQGRGTQPQLLTRLPWAYFKTLDAWAIPQRIFKTPQVIPVCSQGENNWSTREQAHPEMHRSHQRQYIYSIMTIHCLVYSNCFLPGILWVLGIWISLHGCHNNLRQ